MTKGRPMFFTPDGTPEDNQRFDQLMALLLAGETAGLWLAASEFGDAIAHHFERHFESENREDLAGNHELLAELSADLLWWVLEYGPLAADKSVAFWSSVENSASRLVARAMGDTEAELEAWRDGPWLSGQWGCVIVPDLCSPFGLPERADGEFSFASEEGRWMLRSAIEACFMREAHLGTGGEIAHMFERAEQISQSPELVDLILSSDEWD